MSEKIKLLNVTFNIPPGYRKSSENRVISIEYKNGNVTQTSLDANGMEPTFKLANGQTLSKGSKNKITVDETVEVISTIEKYSNGSNEITFLVKRYIASREICRTLKKAVDKHANVTYNHTFDGYQANLDDGNYVLYGVNNRCLIVITTNDLLNAAATIENKKMNTMALIRLVAGALVILFALYALIKLGFDSRILILIAIAIVFISTGYNQLYQKDIECPKLDI